MLNVGVKIGGSGIEDRRGGARELGIGVMIQSVDSELDETGREQI